MLFEVLYFDLELLSVSKEYDANESYIIDYVLAPGIIGELEILQNELELPQQQLKADIKNYFNTRPCKVFTATEAANMIIAALNHDTDIIEEIIDKVNKRLNRNN